MAEHTKSVKLGEIIREFDLEILHKGPDYEDTPLTTLDVNRPGLPLSGFFEHFDTRRLLVIGLTEHTFLNQMTPEERRAGPDPHPGSGALPRVHGNGHQTRPHGAAHQGTDLRLHEQPDWQPM